MCTANTQCRPTLRTGFPRDPMTQASRNGTSSWGLGFGSSTVDPFPRHLLLWGACWREQSGGGVLWREPEEEIPALCWVCSSTRHHAGGNHSKLHCMKSWPHSQPAMCPRKSSFFFFFLSHPLSPQRNPSPEFLRIRGLWPFSWDFWLQHNYNWSLMDRLSVEAKKLQGLLMAEFPSTS